MPNYGFPPGAAAGGDYQNSYMNMMYFSPAMMDNNFFLTTVRNQVEFYLSKDNLLRDTFLRAQMDSDGFVPLAVIANFNRMKAITNDISVIKTALSESSVVEVQDDRVRRQ